VSAVPNTAMKTIEHLTERIGCRVAGSDAEHEAADYLFERLTGLGFAPVVQRFRFRSWRSVAPGRLLLEDGAPEETVDGRMLPYTAGTSSRGVRGRISWEGQWTLIPPQGVFDRFHLTSDQGDVLAAVLAPQHGLARPFPNPFPLLDTPTIVVDSSVGRRLLEAISMGRPPRGVVICPEGEMWSASSTNVVAGGAQSGRLIAVVAHYDSVEGSVGANDNASGVAVLLRVLERLTRSSKKGQPNVLCALFGAEEPFLIGSRAFISAFPLGGKTSRIGACLNLDMLGHGENFAIRRPEGSVWAGVASSLGGRSDGDIDITQTPSFPSSDHWAFHEAGIPSAQLTREGDTCYHTPDDLVTRLLGRDLEDAEELAVQLVEKCWRTIDA
jgi:aminopeptidase YwaD